MLRVICSLLGLAALACSQKLPPHLEFVHPVPGSARVPTNTVLVHNRLLNSAFTVSLRLATNPEVEIPLRRVVPANYYAAFLRPEVALQPNTSYQVTISPDEGDNPAPFRYLFTTGDGPDLESPRLLSVTPEPGSVLQAGQPVSFQFQEPLIVAGYNQPVHGWQNVVTQSTDRQYLSDVSEFLMRLSADRRTIEVFPPAGALAFRLSMFPNALFDLAGNPGATQVREDRNYFRRMDGTFTPVLVTHTFPEEGQVSVHRAASVQLLFNQEASSAILSGAENFLELTRDGQKEEFQVSSFAHGRGLLINPRTSLLQAEAKYSLRVKASALQGFSPRCRMILR